jgi:hypothetical protein
VLFGLYLRIVENMNVFSAANMCLFYAMNTYKLKLLSNIHGTRRVCFASARIHASISVSPLQEQQYCRTYRQ